MIGVHVEFHIKPDQIDRFLDWKVNEGELQIKAPGFIKRSMSRSNEDPNVYFYVSYWKTEEQMRAFSQRPEFAEAQQRTGVLDAVAERRLSYVTEVFDEKGTLPEG